MTDTLAREARAAARAAQKDTFPIQAIDYVEFYVGNAIQAAHYYRMVWGYDIVGYRGPETGMRDQISYVLEQGRVRLVLTAGLGPDSPAARHAALHGDGVKDIAFRVPDVEQAYQTALSRGAQGVQEPRTVEDDQGRIVTAAIATYGETIHSLVQRDGYPGTFMPQFRPHLVKGRSVGLRVIDHIVGNVELGRMDEWVNFYSRVMGFEQLVHFSDEQISTEYSALMSKVVQDGTGKIKFPINEPAVGKKKSQIDEYLEFYRGPGAQHVAIATGDIVATVEALQANGRRVPADPQHLLSRNCPPASARSRSDLDRLEALSILADRDEDGYLLQIFSKPVEDRPTLFYEIDRAPRRARLRRRQLQGAVRGHRARTGATGEFVVIRD